MDQSVVKRAVPLLQRLLLGTLLGLPLAQLPLAGPARADGSTLRIGLLGDESGITADVGGPGSVLAAQMAAEDAGGTVLGRRIEVISADFHYSPDTAAGIARRWLDTEGVDVIADLPVTPAALAVQEVARQKNKVTLVTGASSNDITARACNPFTVHWADDNAAIANSTARAVLADGGKSWFFLTADFGFGHAMEDAAGGVVKAGGGTVLGHAVHPVNAGDFSPFLATAKSSGAQVLALASVGADTVNAISQAHEFGLAAGQRLAGLVVFVSDVHALGLDKAQGLLVASGFYWDQNDEARTWSQRFFARRHAMPTRDQASTYAVVRQYLQAVKEAGTTDAAEVVRAMKRIPVDYFGHKGSIRADGRVLYDMTLYQVKAPGESKAEWDLYKPLTTVPAAGAFLPLDAARCNFQ